MIPPMRAAILAVGSELLSTDRLDTNSLVLAASLERHGVALIEKAVAGDDESTIASVLGRLTEVADLVLVTGGLGPTADDRTRAAAAAAFDRTLAEDPEQVVILERRFAAYGRPMAAVNRRQAEVPSGATPLANQNGSAPGLRLEHDGTTVFLLPGVPREVGGMIDDHLEPWLAARTSPPPRARRTLKTTGLGESSLEGRLEPVYDRFGEASIAVLASPGEVRVVLSAEGEAAEESVSAMTEAVREVLGPWIYGFEEEETLEAVVGRALLVAGKTSATAESCTGGLLGERLTRVPGSSSFFVGGVITYSNDLKERFVDVPRDALVAHGAVSAPVARAMALGVRNRCRADYGISITGIAGPGGGSDAKPVGTVYIALAPPDGDETICHRMHFMGDRTAVRWRSAQHALDMVRRHLGGLPLDEDAG